MLALIPIGLKINMNLSFIKKSIPPAILAIGISSLLLNMATTLMFSGTALYMRTVLCTSVAAVGFLEACVEAIAYSVRIFSGVFSDYLSKRKPIILVGFILLCIAKPILAFSKTIGQIFLARALDRIGNGIQATPRDALVGEIAPKEHRGACYGLRNSLSVIGSTFGGIFGIVIMRCTENDFQMLFLLATVPSIFAIFVFAKFVNEKKLESYNKRRKMKFSDLKLLGMQFWLLMCIVFVFMLGRFSEVFITLLACDKYGLNIGYGTSITMIYNLLATLASYPAGKFSDRYGGINVLLFGIIIACIAHLTIFSAPNIWFLMLGTVIWGVQVGIGQSIISTLVASYIPKDLRGTGFGVYYFLTAASTAIATIVAGIASDKAASESAAFFIGFFFCLMAAIFLIAIKRKLYNKN